jgi:DNA-binding MarR family transcriptional regulator
LPAVPTPGADDPSPVGAQALSARAAGEELPRAAAALDRLLLRAARAEGLTVLQARLLRTVLDAVPQRELARALAVDPARVSVLTAHLEARGLVERVPAEGDRRQRVTLLTGGRSTAWALGSSPRRRCSG